LQQATAKGTFWQRCTLNFLDNRMNYKAKDIIGKITNLVCIYLFKYVDKFINSSGHDSGVRYWLINQTTRVRFLVKSSGFFKSLPSFGGDVKLSVPATT
jgi:hypothetical protein